MERETRKRERFTEEIVAAQAKRPCCFSNCEDDNVLNEIAPETDANEASYSSSDNMEKNLVTDIMKPLHQELMPSSLCKDESSTSNERHERAVNVENGSPLAEDSVAFNSCNDDFEYLWGVDDDELGIPTSPEMDLVETVNEDCFYECDYNPDYGFFECLVMGREVEQQLLLQNLWCLNDSNDVWNGVKI